MNKERYYHKLETIKESGNYRILREIEHNGFLIHDEEFREETDVMGLPYSAVSSRLLSGNHPYYKMLEDDLADLYDKEAALVFNSGYHANIGILPALTNKRDLIVADKLVHASIIDGLRLSEAQMIRYKHLDYEHLRSILTHHREEYDNVFIVTESIFSMDGDTADLQQLWEIKKEFDAFLYVDEAQVFRDYLINTQRSLIFTTALPPVNVAWTRFILNRMPDFYDLRIKLAEIASKLRQVLVEKGFETRGDSHIVPMVCGSNESSVEMSELLRDNGFFVLPVRYPTVPKNEARIRFSLNASIPIEDYGCLFEFLECLVCE